MRPFPNSCHSTPSLFLLPAFGCRHLRNDRSLTQAIEKQDLERHRHRFRRISRFSELGEGEIQGVAEVPRGKQSELSLPWLFYSSIFGPGSLSAGGQTSRHGLQAVQRLWCKRAKTAIFPRGDRVNIGTPPTARNVDCMNDTVAEHKREVVVDQKMAHAHLVELKSGRPGPCFFLLVPRDRRPGRGIC